MQPTTRTQNTAQSANGLQVQESIQNVTSSEYLQISLRKMEHKHENTFTQHHRSQANQSLQRRLVGKTT